MNKTKKNGPRMKRPWPKLDATWPKTGHARPAKALLRELRRYLSVTTTVFCTRGASLTSGADKPGLRLESGPAALLGSRMAAESSLSRLLVGTYLIELSLPEMNHSEYIYGTTVRREGLAHHKFQQASVLPNQATPIIPFQIVFSIFPCPFSLSRPCRSLFSHPRVQPFHITVFAQGNDSATRLLWASVTLLHIRRRIS